MKSLDRIDRAILNLLQHDGRMSHREIAEQVGLSTPAVSKRIKRFEKNGTIKGYRAELDASKCNLAVEVNALVLARDHDPKALAEFEAEVKNNCPNICYCKRVSGSYDYMLRAVTETGPEYFEILKQLQAMKGVQRVWSLHVLPGGFSSMLPLIKDQK